MASTEPTPADDERLAELGYTSHFRREMSLWANFSLGFTYLSPVVGIYTLFGISLATGGPPMIWSLAIVGVGQMLVALVFGEIVSQYPVAGGVYPWARRLWGKRWAWMTGWVYFVALLATIASVSYGAGPYVAAFLGIESSIDATIVCALVILLIATLINLSGTRMLRSRPDDVPRRAGAGIGGRRMLEIQHCLIRCRRTVRATEGGRRGPRLGERGRGPGRPGQAVRVPRPRRARCGVHREGREP